jgi:hypothetical protein
MTTTLHLKLEGDQEITVDMPMLPRIGETILAQGKAWKITSLMYNLDRDPIEVYVVTKPDDEFNAALGRDRAQAREKS